jgi:energy-coupling factor transporter ATP-binding protein EcfA2
MTILKTLSIENFKGIGRRVSFDFKPITLFFGQNSAGKSTVLHALNYLHDILQYHRINADNTSLGHDAIDLGGFQQFVHQHDLDKIIVFDLLLDVRAYDLTETDAAAHYQELLYSRNQDDESKRLFDISQITSSIDSVLLKFQIAWSERLAKPYVKRFEIELNDERFIEITASSDCRRREITYVNLTHPLFLRLEDFAEDGLFTLTEAIIDGPFLDRQGQSLIGLENAEDALPDHKAPLNLADIWLGDSWDDADRKTEFKGILSTLLLGSLEVAAKELAKMRYLGPIRQIPSRNYTPKPTENPNWSDGLAAWDLLFKKHLSLLPEVNEWLSCHIGEGNQRLATGYALKIAEYRQLPIGSRLESLLQVQDINQNKSEIEQLLEQLPVQKQFILTDVRRNVDVYPGDVGIGISQLLPVVVGALATDIPLLTIEQPELHIHPALQVALGDLFIHTAKQKGKSFIMETHSEHVMLRLLRRVRETASGELENPEYAIQPDDLNVVYVDCIDGETRLIRLRVDEEGEFIDRWPNGFFGERAEELF